MRKLFTLTPPMVQSNRRRLVYLLLCVVCYLPYSPRCRFGNLYPCPWGLSRSDWGPWAN